MGHPELASIFAEIADILEILQEDPFRINSYRRASRVLAETTADVAALAAEKALTTIAGVGKSTAAKIEEYLATGQIAMHQELRAKVPPGLLELMVVQGLGPKTASKLWRELNIQSLADLKSALNEHPAQVEALPGLGPKKVASLKEALAHAETAVGRVRIDEGWRLARLLIEAVSRCPSAGKLEAAGSLRRWRETIGDIDIACQGDPENSGPIMDAFAAAPGVLSVLVKGKTKTSVLTQAQVQADLRVVPEASYGAALQYFTGSKAHNVKLREIALKQKLRLNEYGLFKLTRTGEQGRQVAGADEPEIYRKLGLAWVAPELREDRGELEAAREGRLPELLRPEQIRGDLHMHTVATDGTATASQMADAAKRLGYQYIAITDHSKSQPQTHGLNEPRLVEQIELIRQVRRNIGDVHILTGIEVDILKDGGLDLSDEVLAELDFVMASPHSGLTGKGPEATRRIIRAIEHPLVHAIGHPTGRIVNGRRGMELDMPKIAQAAAANGVALEINANPSRLDLRDVHVKCAVEAGAKLCICTDAHEAAIPGELTLVNYGVATARRGWATVADVINAWPLDELTRWLRKKR